MNILMFNGLLFLLFMWTSAEMGPETEHTEELQVYANESRVNILARKRACENLDGKCIKTKKDCPSNLHLETKPGRSFCSKNHRCCYPGPSCNLVWDYKEERPLIMIRESKTIVPPVTDIDVSDNPNRIPIGRKLIFACPGENNQFNHVGGIHTKLYGECISHDHFKVCVNNKPEILDLSQLSCSSRMFPSFIKDTDISVKSCDGIGGELYKTGYTYGDDHEFKDLEIEVCFNEKNPTTLCTSPNLNGNEADYRAADHPRTDPQVDGCGAGNDRLWTWIHRPNEVSLQCQTACSYVHRNVRKHFPAFGPEYGLKRNFKWCFTDAARTTWGFCGCPNANFVRKHVCLRVDGNDCNDRADALDFSRRMRLANDVDASGNPIIVIITPGGVITQVTQTTVFISFDITYTVSETRSRCNMDRAHVTYTCHWAHGEWSFCQGPFMEEYPSLYRDGHLIN